MPFPDLIPGRLRREETAARSAGGMAGAADERGPGSAAGEQLQQQHVACQVFPERLAQGKPGQGFLSSFFTNNQKCQLMLLKTLETSRSRDPGVGRVVSETRRAGVSRFSPRCGWSRVQAPLRRV